MQVSGALDLFYAQDNYIKLDINMSNCDFYK